VRKTPREVFSYKKSKFCLNKIQRSVLIGTMLGDGGLRFRGKNCRLHIKHSLKQLSLVNYKWRIFEPIISMKVRCFSQKVGIKDYNFAEFVTLTHPIFTHYYQLFYKNNKKTITNEVADTIDPLVLAVWIMDDGSAEYAGLSIQTHSFSEAEVSLLIKAIKKNIGIQTSKRINKGKYIIYFPFRTLQELKSKLGKYILPEFEYKFVPYREKPRRDCTPDSDENRSMIQSDLCGNVQS